MTSPIDIDISKLSKYQKGIASILKAEIDAIPVWIYDPSSQSERINPNREKLILNWIRYIDVCSEAMRFKR